MIALDYMLPRNHARRETENYVSSPPALFIRTDDGSSIFALGLQEFSHHKGGRGGMYHYNVLRNGRETGEWACRIEKHGGRVSIYTPEGRKRWTGKVFI